MKRAAAFLLITLFVYSSLAHAEDFSQDEHLHALSSTELAQYRGGYVLPNGLEINIGVSIQSTVSDNGLSASSPSLGALGSTVPIASATLIKLSGQEQVQTFVQTAAANAGANVQNALSNAVIQQLTNVNIDVANFTKLQSPAAATISGLSGQIRSSTVVGLH